MTLVIDFVDLMREHVKEETILFMMADSILQLGEQAELVAGFEKLEMKAHLFSHLCFLVLLLGTLNVAVFAQGNFKIITGKRLKDAAPRDFYLEGNAIPVEKRNSVLIETPGHTRALFALIVTAGFASRIQQKYSGMLISEGRLSVCGKDAGIGSYGFGLHLPPNASNRDAEFFLYNQAGNQILECDMEKDLQLREPKPLQVIIEPPRSARLYLGRYWLKLGP